MKEKLIKKANELFFKYIKSKNDKISAITTKSNPEDYMRVVSCIRSSEVNKENEENKTELVNIIRDLTTLSLENEIRKPKSKTAVMLFDYKEKVQSVINKNFKCSVTASKVASTLEEKSKESYFVGGCVRDAYKGKTPKDIDFVTDTPVSELVEPFKMLGFKCDEVGLQFHVLIVSKNGEFFEIANFRKDRDNSGGELGNIEDDARRRDFSIGAGYIRITDNTLVDPNGTFVDDIQTNTLRFVGKAQDRLKEDPIRAYRFMRFVQRGFTPDKRSLSAVREKWNECTAKSNAERIRLEIEKMAGIL